MILPLGHADWRLRETDLNLSDVDSDAKAVTFADQCWKIGGRFAQDHFLA